VTTYQYVLVVPASSSFKTISDLIKNAKEKPGQLSYGSTGIGGGNHLAGELLALTTGTQLNHIPYKGSAPALADLLGGQLSFMFDTVVTSVPQIRGGKLRAFAVSGPARAAVLPDVPTLQELGYKGFEITQWQGFFAPAGTDRAIVAKLREEVAKTLAQKDVVERLVTQGGNEIVGNTPEQFARVVEADLARYARLIRDAKIRAE
jgi:tripartite-type tricarboxylate transporter receptor subunit TctC